MATVKVYQFDYFDRLLKRDRRSVDFATAEAIVARGGTILAETERVVDEELLNDEGMVRAADMPPRPIDPERDGRTHWVRPDDTRSGPG